MISGYVGSMGFGLPAALVAQLTYPTRQVVCTTGDGGFTMVKGDFTTAVANELPITVILLDNAKLAMIEHEQDDAGVPHFATDLRRIDFARFADSCGGEGFRVEAPHDLKEALKSALSAKEPTLVDIVTDPRRRWTQPEQRRNERTTRLKRRLAFDKRPLEGWLLKHPRLS